MHWRRWRPRLISEPCWQQAIRRTVTPPCRRAASCGRIWRRPSVPGHTATTAKARRIARRCRYSRLANGMLERYPGASSVTAPPRGIIAPPSGSFPVRPRAGSGLLVHARNRASAGCRRPITGRSTCIPLAAPSRGSALIGRGIHRSNRLVRKRFHESVTPHVGSCRRWSSVDP
jgi:hypothetical protein